MLVLCLLNFYTFSLSDGFSLSRAVLTRDQVSYHLVQSTSYQLASLPCFGNVLVLMSMQIYGDSCSTGS